MNWRTPMCLARSAQSDGRTFRVLLDAGIDVMTNMNIQHLESLNDQIFRITGVRVRETVPDWFVKSAD